jgi:hypothetical protein
MMMMMTMTATTTNELKKRMRWTEHMTDDVFIPELVRNSQKSSSLGKPRCIWTDKVFNIGSTFFNWYSGGGWSPIGSTRHCGHQLPIVPAPGDYDNGEIGGMIGKGNRSTRRKPVQMPLCPPQTLHAEWTRTRAAAVGSQRLTA